MSSAYFLDARARERFLGCRQDQRWVNPSRRRTRAEYPYSYDEFFIFGSRSTIKAAGVHADYNDRLYQWDAKKFDALWAKHVGRRWDQAGRAQLSAFLSAYHGRPVQVIALAEGCNPSNGYPYWIVWYRDVAATTPGAEP